MPVTVPTNIEYHFAAEVVKRDNIHHRLMILAEEYYQTMINKIPLGEKVSITVTSKKPKRTEAQNRYYWHYLGLIKDETGNDIDDLHNLFKGKFLSTGIAEVFGEKVRKTKSTTELSISDFSEYIKKIEVLTGVLSPETSGYWTE